MFGFFGGIVDGIVVGLVGVGAALSFVDLLAQCVRVIGVVVALSFVAMLQLFIG